MIAYAMVVLWLDLSLSVLRTSAIVIPFLTGFTYFGERPRLSSFDTLTTLTFATASVAAMNAVLAWVDGIPIMPQDTAAWRESLFYVLSIGASMFSGMLLRLSKTALSARGLTSFPQLREGILSVNKNLPTDTLKAIELTLLFLGTAITAIMGLLASVLGLSK